MIYIIVIIKSYSPYSPTLNKKRVKLVHKPRKKMLHPPTLPKKILHAPTTSHKNPPPLIPIQEKRSDSSATTHTCPCLPSSQGHNYSYSHKEGHTHSDTPMTIQNKCRPSTITHTHEEAYSHMKHEFDTNLWKLILRIGKLNEKNKNSYQILIKKRSGNWSVGQFWKQWVIVRVMNCLLSVTEGYVKSGNVFVTVFLT